MEQRGQSAPEISPWRFNLITNYAFIEGPLKGVNVGGGYRWQDETIIGYGLKDDADELDVNKPIYGESEGYLDLWVGYQRKLTDSVDWRIQINARNVGQDTSLTPVSANPDGTYATMRIVEGTTWSITNTFSF